ncbi:sodium:proton antiporter [bacterium]|nr:sodium:proton antiporter [bacterium]
MNHIPPLIYDLGIILSTAGAVLILFRWLKQPIVLGYLMAGVLLSPHTSIFPSVREPESVKIWAEIGVIFLLFGLGLEFSFRKLVQVGKTSVIAAMTEVSLMIFLGFGLGRALGWSSMDAIFLGGIMAISSTAIIIRAFEELKLKGQKFTQSVFGILIVEDLVAVLLLVLLSTIGISRSFSGEEMVSELLRLSYYLLLWFMVGLFLVPIFLKKARGLLTDEMSLIVGLGLCLLMVILAGEAGFSPALGAFVMGSILAETREGKRIDRLFIPIRNLFAAIFFVSVGMLIDIQLLKDLWVEVLVITGVLVVGKVFGVTLGSLLSGKGLKHSIETGTSMAQIGEFSFLIATLGLSLNVIRPELYPIAVSVSAISAFLTPYLIQRAPWLHQNVEKRVPEVLFRGLLKYQQAFTGLGKETLLPAIFRAIGIKIILNSVLVVAISLGMKWAFLLLFEDSSQSPVARLGVALLNLMLVSPFLWAIWLGRLETKSLQPQTVLRIKKFQLGLSVIRTVIVVYLLVFSLSQFIPVEAVSGFLLLGVTLILGLGRKIIRKWYIALERQLLSHIGTEDSSLLPWDVGFGEFEVHPHSSLVGQTLSSSALRTKFGVSVSLIKRGERTLFPSPEDVFMPHDQVYVVGDESQLDEAAASFDENMSVLESSSELIGLQSLALTEDSQFANQAIRECGIKDRFNGLVVGVERGSERILNPQPDLILRSGDRLWILGDLNKIDQ